MLPTWFAAVQGDLFGSMMTYLENDVLPFPHVKGIDLGPAMKRKVDSPCSFYFVLSAFALEFHGREHFSLRG